jgi:hypothetical protein
VKIEIVQESQWPEARKGMRDWSEVFDQLAKGLTLRLEDENLKSGNIVSAATYRKKRVSIRKVGQGSFLVREVGYL